MPHVPCPAAGLDSSATAQYSCKTKADAFTLHVPNTHVTKGKCTMPETLVLCTADPRNYFGLVPQHYSANYYLTEDNFAGNDTQADTTFIAESSMLVTVMRSSQQVVFNSLGLNFTSLAYVLDGWIPVCLCGMQSACLVGSCNRLIQPVG